MTEKICLIRRSKKGNEKEKQKKSIMVWKNQKDHYHWTIVFVPKLNLSMSVYGPERQGHGPVSQEVQGTPTSLKNRAHPSPRQV